VVWRWEERNGNWDKPPYQPNGRPAKTNDPATWVSFEAAVAALEGGRFDGVGFVLTADDPYAMVDLDHCVDLDSGVIEAWAVNIIDQLRSYTEITPSGVGLRVIVKGILSPGRRKRGMGSGGGVELYDQLRYMTMTGNLLAGTPETIEEREKEITQVHALLFAEIPNGRRAETDSARMRTRLYDDALLAKARTAKNRSKFCSLYDRGDISAYTSASEADLALSGILAFWTGGDAEQIDRLFRRSALFRQEKWDAKHYADGKSYGQATVAKAVAGTREFYQAKNHHVKNEMMPPAQRRNGHGGLHSEQERPAARENRARAALGPTQKKRARASVETERYLVRPGKFPPGITGAWPSGKRWIADENGHPVPLVEESE